MAEYGTLARPYAKAAFDFAVSQDSLEKWADILALFAMISSDEQVKQLINNPNLDPQKRIEFFLSVADDKIDDSIANFIRILATNDRLLVLPAIAELFVHLKNEHEKTSKVRVISAIALDEKQKANIANKLKAKFNREVSLDVEIDASIIGGMIIEAQDLVIDASVRGKLSRLTEVLQS
ncbi:MAG: F0F1 ATP synthase subunit delta [Pseudomonadota bacterium]